MVDVYWQINRWHLILAHSTYKTFADLEIALERTMNYFVEKMIPCCEAVEKGHIAILPTAFLSSVIDDCMEKALM